MAGSISATRAICDLPGPRGLPLIGSLHRLGLHDAHLMLEAWCERYGPLYTFRAGPRRFVVLSDREAANALLRDRPQGFRRQREVETVFKELGFHSRAFVNQVRRGLLFRLRRLRLAVLLLGGMLLFRVSSEREARWGRR